MKSGRSCLLLALLTGILIISAGCMAVDPPASTQNKDLAGTPLLTPEMALVMNQMQDSQNKGANWVFSYIISGDSGDKTRFYESRGCVEILDGRMRTLIDASKEPRREYLLGEYEKVDEKQRAMIRSAELVLEEYDDNAVVSETTLRRFNEELSLMKSAFDEFFQATSDKVLKQPESHTKEFVIVSLMTRQEEMIGSFGDAPDFIPPDYSQ
ncbi:hypothetical protein [Methanocalculus sp. MC3]